MERGKKDDYEFETYLGYFGGVEQVMKAMEECPKCGNRMSLGHFSDTGNLLVHETARCLSCDFGQRKVIHALN